MITTLKTKSVSYSFIWNSNERNFSRVTEQNKDLYGKILQPPGLTQFLKPSKNVLKLIQVQKQMFFDSTEKI